MTLSDMVAEEYGWMLGQAMRLCRNRMDAEDLTGDAVLKILGSGEKYDSGRPFRPWASVIILNTYITRFNHDSLLTATDIDSSALPASSDSTQSRVLLSEILRAVRRCRQRSASVDCVIMYARGFSYDEIAAYYSIPTGTVRSRINYARSLLRKELGIQYVK